MEGSGICLDKTLKSMSVNQLGRTDLLKKVNTGKLCQKNATFLMFLTELLFRRKMIGYKRKIMEGDFRNKFLV